MEHAEARRDWPVSLIHFSFSSSTCCSAKKVKGWKLRVTDEPMKVGFFPLGKTYSHSFLLNLVSDLHTLPVLTRLLLFASILLVAIVAPHVKRFFLVAGGCALYSDVSLTQTWDQAE